MTETVRAAEMSAPFHIRESRRPAAGPGSGEVELQVGFVGICGTDIHAFNGYAPIFDFPVVFGHEFSARVLRCGPGVRRLAEGQWTSVAPLLSCGDCFFCRSGNAHLCENRVIFGAKEDGALRERIVMPAELVFALPAGVSPPAATLGEPLAVAVHAVNRGGGDLEDASIIISGAGAIGLLIALVVEQRGAEQILLLEPDEDRQNFAKQLGFQVAHPDQARSASADLLFICSGSPSAITATPDLLAPLGTAVVVGVLSEAALNWVDLLWKEGSIVTSRYFTLPEYEEGIQLLGIEGFRAWQLIEERVPFAGLFEENGKKVMNQARQVVRLVVEMV